MTKTGGWLLGSLIVLTACAEVPDAKNPPPICPQTAIVKELDTIRLFKTPDAKPSTFVAGARMESIEGTCAYQEKGIDVSFTVNVLGERGPLLANDQTSFPYFAAVIGPDGAILNKQKMDVHIAFSGKNKMAPQEEKLHVFIPLPKDQRATGPSYRVLVGFQVNK